MSLILSLRNACAAPNPHRLSYCCCFTNSLRTYSPSGLTTLRIGWAVNITCCFLLWLLWLKYLYWKNNVTTLLVTYYWIWSVDKPEANAFKDNFCNPKWWVMINDGNRIHLSWIFCQERNSRAIFSRSCYLLTFELGDKRVFVKGRTFCRAFLMGASRHDTVIRPCHTPV